jgi:uncharacterized membrane protein
MSATAAVAEKTFAEGLQLVDPPRSVSAGKGIDWIPAGWRLFTPAWLMWIVSILVLVVLAIVVNLVPVIGGLAFQVLNPVFAAGFVVACRAVEKGGEFEIEHLFAGFKHQFANLAIVGLLLLAGWVAIFLVVAAIVGFGIFGILMSGGDAVTAIAASGMSIALGLLVMLALMVPLMMFYWFAPALVIMHGTPPIAALKASFSGCLRNMVPFLVWGLVMTVLCLVLLIPFGLGMLVWIPLAITSSYAAYRDIYTDAEAAPVPATVRF